MSITALNTAATNMQACTIMTDVISNNLANLGTTAYKRYQPVFQDLLYRDEKRVGTNPVGDIIIPSGLQVGLGVKTAAISRINQQGELKQTSNKWDLAIKGEGYFVVELADGTLAYTRDGSFTLSPDGEIITFDGYKLQPNIQIPSNTLEVTISESGVVSTKSSQSSPWQIQGTIDLATFNNEGGLLALGKNLLVATAASGNANVSSPGIENVGVLVQGWLEASNVNPITEITNLITAQRGYEMGSKVIQAVDEMQQTINTLKR